MNDVQEFLRETDRETFETGYMIGRSAVRRVALRNKHLSLPFVATSDNQVSQINMGTRLQAESLLAQGDVNETALRAGMHVGIGDCLIVVGH